MLGERLKDGLEQQGFCCPCRVDLSPIPRPKFWVVYPGSGAEVWGLPDVWWIIKLLRRLSRSLADERVVSQPTPVQQDAAESPVSSGHRLMEHQLQNIGSSLKRNQQSQ